MHGLNTIVKLNSQQQKHVAEVLAKPVPQVDLFAVWRDLKEEQAQKHREVK